MPLDIGTYAFNVILLYNLKKINWRNLKHSKFYLNNNVLCIMTFQNIYSNFNTIVIQFFFFNNVD